jgi:2-polyprenyl-3-methyl-5-hydroxy-6-metoxy-1,4-benzoquinol methylase
MSNTTMTYKDYLDQAQSEISALNPNGYYETYKKYEFGYWQYIPNWIFRYCQNNNVKNTLDVGVAYGTLALFTKLISSCDLYGVDFVKYISDDLVKKYDIKYQINNIEIEQFPWDIKFDVILFTEIMEHLNYNILPTLLKIKSLLSKNGKIFLSTPDAFFWGKCNEYKNWQDMPDISKIIEIKDQHIYQFGETELLEIFKTVGLKFDKIMWADGFNGMKHFNIQLSKG